MRRRRERIDRDVVMMVVREGLGRKLGTPGVVTPSVMFATEDHGTTCRFGGTRDGVVYASRPRWSIRHKPAAAAERPRGRPAGCGFARIRHASFRRNRVPAPHPVERRTGTGRTCRSSPARWDRRHALSARREYVHLPGRARDCWDHPPRLRRPLTQFQLTARRDTRLSDALRHACSSESPHAGARPAAESPRHGSAAASTPARDSGTAGLVQWARRPLGGWPGADGGMRWVRTYSKKSGNSV